MPARQFHAGLSVTDPAVRARVAEVARASYGRLVALLAAPTRDIAAAEDAMSDAVERALTTWPTDGIPGNPQGWLLTVARNRLRDRYRSAAHRTSTMLDEEVDPVAAPSSEPALLEDKRLELMFVCAHPAIDPTVRTPLMLQTVLGCDAEQIAAAYGVPTSTMAQRLVRAKRRIRDAGVPFAVPQRDVLRPRLAAVLEAVYGAFAIDWRGIAGVTERDSLSGEALYLARTLAELMPDEPEVLGLNALIALSAARAPARVDSAQRFVPVHEQDPSCWDATLVTEGEDCLARAHRFGEPGRFQLEAAVQSVHCARRISGRTDWAALETIYRALLDVAPTLGAAVSLSVVLGERGDPAAGLRFLDGLDAPHVDRFQPAWAARAHLLDALGDREAAGRAFERASALATDPLLRNFLDDRRKSLQS